MGGNGGNVEKDFGGDRVWPPHLLSLCRSLLKWQIRNQFNP